MHTSSDLVRSELDSLPSKVGSETINTLENVRAQTAGMRAGLANGGSLPLPLNCLPGPSGAILSQTVSLSSGVLITHLGQRGELLRDNGGSVS